MIASIAATEVDGVSAMAGNITNELMGKVGMKSLTKGVKVSVYDRNVIKGVKLKRRKPKTYLN